MGGWKSMALTNTLLQIMMEDRTMGSPVLKAFERLRVKEEKESISVGDG